MAESGLSLSRTDLRNSLSWFLGFGLTAASASVDQQTIIDRCLDAGTRLFYSPLPLPGERIAHIWSFMQPELVLSVDQSSNAFDLPDDFGGLVGGLYLSADDLSWDTIEVTGYARILQERQRDSETTTGAPKYVAIQALASDGTGGQRFSLAVWPTPDSTYTFKGTYYSNPYQLSATALYPLGGQPHAETLREAVLAVAERDVNDQPQGTHNATFRERMIASVNLDRRLTGPKSFGMNSDGKRSYSPDFGRYGYTTYNGEREIT